MSQDDAEDRRIRRTRTALNEAFITLVLARPYNEIQVAEIADEAQVGRSTFYEHYSNKDDLLRQSLDGAFQALADAAIEANDTERLTFWTTEFWNNRKVGRILLSGETRPFLNRQLADLIHKRLPRKPGAPPAELVAAALAEAQLGLIHAWQTGRVATTPAAIAEILHKMSSAAVAALF